MDKLVNLTPHAINFVDENGDVVKTLEGAAEADLCRVTFKSTIVGMVDGIQIEETRFGEVEGLPPQKEGVCYVVSRLVANAAANRDDLLVPSQQVRDSEGKIVGCRSLSR